MTVEHRKRVQIFTGFFSRLLRPFPPSPWPVNQKATTPYHPEGLLVFPLLLSFSLSPTTERTTSYTFVVMVLKDSVAEATTVASTTLTTTTTFLLLLNVHVFTLLSKVVESRPRAL